MDQLRLSSNEFHAPRFPGTNLAASINPFESVAVIGESESPTRSLKNRQSFGGGFQFPKKHVQEQSYEDQRAGVKAKGRRPPSAKDTAPTNALQDAQYGENLIDALEQELNRLKGETQIIEAAKERREKARPRSPIKKESMLHVDHYEPPEDVAKETDFAALQADAPFMTLKELESIRADHEARLCRVEAEYYRKSAVLPKYEEPKPKKLDTPPPPDRMRGGVRFAEERQETEESDKAETDPLAAWGINKTSGHLFATPGAGSLMKKKVEEPQAWEGVHTADHSECIEKGVCQHVSATSKSLLLPPKLPARKVHKEPYESAWTMDHSECWKEGTCTHCFKPAVESATTTFLRKEDERLTKSMVAAPIRKPSPERVAYETKFERFRASRQHEKTVHGRALLPKERPPPERVAFESPEEITMLKWMFSKLDADNSGAIDKLELLQEIHQSQYLADLFGFSADILEPDYLEKFEHVFDSIGHGKNLTFDEFLMFFQVGENQRVMSMGARTGGRGRTQIIREDLGPTSLRKSGQRSTSAGAKTRSKSPAKTATTKTVRIDTSGVKAAMGAQKAASPKTQPTDRVCMLNAKQIGMLGSVFDVLDAHNDLVVRRERLVDQMRSDAKISKILAVDALRLGPNQILTLEQVLDFIERDGARDELITWKQFVDYFYRRPKFVESKEGSTKKVQFDDDPRLDEITLAANYMDMIHELFESLPKISPHQISTHKFVSSFKEHNQLKSIMDFVAREPKGLPIEMQMFPESVNMLLNRMMEEASSLISWEDVLGYFSLRGHPKEVEKGDEGLEEFNIDLISEQEVKPKMRESAAQVDLDPDTAMLTDAKRPKSAAPKGAMPDRFGSLREGPDLTTSAAEPRKSFSGKSPFSTSTVRGKDYRARSASPRRFNITVPEPFTFDKRDAGKTKGLREQWLDDYMMEMRAEEERELHVRPRINEIPPECKIPLMDSIAKEQQMRRDEVKRASQALTEANAKPFSFYERDVAKQKAPRPQPRTFDHQFKANPIPWQVTIPKYEKMMKEDKAAREERISRAAQASLAKASLPPRMQQHEETRKQAETEPRHTQSTQSFKHKPVPDFGKLQAKFRKALESKKKAKKPIDIQPFDFASDKRMQAKSIKNAKHWETVLDNVQEAERQWKKRSHSLTALHTATVPISKTAKYEAQVRLMQKRNEEKLAQEKKLEDEERKRRERKEKLRARVQNSHAIVDNTEKLRETQEAQRQSFQTALVEKQRDYDEKLRTIQQKVKERPLLFEQDWQTTKSAEIAKIKQLLRTRDVLKAQGLQIKNYFNEEEMLLIEEGDYYQKIGKI